MADYRFGRPKLVSDALSQSEEWIALPVSDIWAEGTFNSQCLSTRKSKSPAEAGLVNHKLVTFLDMFQVAVRVDDRHLTSLKLSISQTGKKLYSLPVACVIGRHYP